MYSLLLSIIKLLQIKYACKAMLVNVNSVYHIHTADKNTQLTLHEYNAALI